MKRLRIEITGIVQGVGFRPFIFALAERFGVYGSVTNTSKGVLVEAEGQQVDKFLGAIRAETPPLAQILSLTAAEIPLQVERSFQIVESRDEGSFTHISPDIAVCDECLSEMRDPQNRRYRYPFINCTNCGPRFTITRQVPYDRQNTTMADFPLCEHCAAEYHDPRNRRFHAQPNACPVCGPRLQFEPADSFSLSDYDDPIEAAQDFLKAGRIIAVKGIGGFHLCCDAMNVSAVQELRARKRRKNKPFALMAATIDIIRRYCSVSDEEASVLIDRRRPIVLLRKLPDCQLPEALAPGNAYLGFMLPYTPIHHLLLEDGGNVFPVLVMTSGNLSDEPIAIGNDEAKRRLAGMADAFLLHNRDIFMRVDDSVVRIVNGKLRFIRRARGYAPEAIDLGRDVPDLFAAGAEVKNTFALTKGRYAIVSQHIGDMENYETLSFFEESLANIKQVYRADPHMYAYDLHPGYLSSQWALKQCARTQAVCRGIQHHYAHVASVIAEHGIGDAPVIGITFDGTGYGLDGTLWGSEFLLFDRNQFIRYAHFSYLPLPGAEQAIRECWRIAVAFIFQAFDRHERMEILDRLGFITKYGEQKIQQMLSLCSLQSFSPLSCGAGRYFDAVSALIGLCDINTYEGEAAIALESIMPAGVTYDPVVSYPYEIKQVSSMVIDFGPMLRRLVEDIGNRISPVSISICFHNTLINVIREIAHVLSQQFDTKTVALSGGVFQNAYVLGQTEAVLALDGFSVFTNHFLPQNDACVSLGQIEILSYTIK
jgi:hydrogenase maturation protein HypF